MRGVSPGLPWCSRGGNDREIKGFRQGRFPAFPSEAEVGLAEEGAVVVGGEGAGASLLAAHQAEDGGDLEAGGLGGAGGVERGSSAGVDVFEEGAAAAGGRRVLDEAAGAVGLGVLADEEGGD